MPEARGSFSASDRERYFKHARELFNAGTMENALKWKWADRSDVVEPGVAGVKWMREQGWYIRGHTLIWPSWRRSPANLSQLADNPDELRRVAAERVRDYATRFKDDIDAWDVVNEPYMHNDFLKILGPEVMADWFRIAREADPTAKLFLNDNGLISEPHATTQLRHQYYLKLIDDLQAAGAPIDGMGFQGHYRGALTPIDQVLRIWDAFAAKGLVLHVTEFDMRTEDDELQARYLRDLLTAAFSHPSVELFQLWHFWEGRSFNGAKGIYCEDWTVKPAAKVLHELMHEEWTTHATGQTGSDGRFGFRGFKGEYRITVTHDGQEKTVEASVAADGEPMVIELAN